MQSSITNNGSEVTIKGDNLWEYSNYKGMWYTKRSGWDSWVLLTNCKSNMKLQTQLNRELKEINNTLDFTNELMMLLKESGLGI